MPILHHPNRTYFKTAKGRVKRPRFRSCLAAGVLGEDPTLWDWCFARGEELFSPPIMRSLTEHHPIVLS
jgi:hypothetical protein